MSPVATVVFPDPEAGAATTRARAVTGASPPRCQQGDTAEVECQQGDTADVEWLECHPADIREARSPVAQHRVRDVGRLEGGDLVLVELHVERRDRVLDV